MSQFVTDNLARALRQRLESLRRAGLDRVPVAVPVIAWSKREKLTRQDEPAPMMALPADSVIQAPTPAPPPQRAVAASPAPATKAAASLFDEPAVPGPVLSLEERTEALATLAAEVAVCARCPQLASTRTQTVFGAGSPSARLMFIGEAPGADEDRTGIPFVGRAGSLLTDMITKGMGLAREDVYIANIIKSRPPENRNPLPDEVAHCLPYLERQIEIIRPEFICMLGKVAASALLETTLPLGRLRARWHRVRGVPAIVTYHPAYLLRNPASKKETWEDLQMLMKAMGLSVPARRKSSSGDS